MCVREREYLLADSWRNPGRQAAWRRASCSLPEFCPDVCLASPAPSPEHHTPGTGQTHIHEHRCMEKQKISEC